MPEVADLIALAVDKNPVDFADTFNDIIRDKAMTALENKRIEIAQSIYGDPEDSTVDDNDDDVGDDEFDSDEELDADVDDEDIDWDDEDLDDLDIDDIDLDDLDLDDLEDDE